MAFVPHTDTEIEKMLSVIGVASVDDLFKEIPKQLIIDGLTQIPTPLSEMALGQLIAARAKKNHQGLCFVGAGAYEHHIPAAVWDIAGRGEFYTAYTPYQAEASQGTLQLIYEFQTMMASLTGMEVSNASLYDGASALAEAVLMAVRTNKKPSKKIAVLNTVCPRYQQTVNTLCHNQQIELHALPFDNSGTVCPTTVAAEIKDCAAVIIAAPNYFGNLEAVDELCDIAKAENTFVIAVVNPISLGLLKEPGSWGTSGADIVCGEGQPLGVPLSCGGPYFGFLCTKQEHIRQMPGRIVGRTVDKTGKTGFTLTLQAREQHIRRSKAKSNICTNQGLLVTAATIYMSLLGSEGLRKVALASHQNAWQLQQRLTQLPGVELVFNGAPRFHEFVLRFTQDIHAILQALAKRGIQGGYAIEHEYPELKNCLLVCATETKTNNDLDYYQQQLSEVLSC